MTKVKQEEPVESPSAASSGAAPQFPLPQGIEALLISSDRPLTEGRLNELLCAGGVSEIRSAIDELNREYAKTGRAFSIERLAGGWQILTRPEYGELLAQLHRDRQHSRLSQAALETLAIISYRQPIMRAEIEAIRGVSCGEVLRSLLERRLVKIVGRAEELGRPMLYGTTREFLKVFGLAGVDDLPVIEGLEGAGGRKRGGVSAKIEAKPAAHDAPNAANAADAANAPDAANAANAANAPESSDDQDDAGSVSDAPDARSDP